MKTAAEANMQERQAMTVANVVRMAMMGVQEAIISFQKNMTVCASLVVDQSVHCRWISSKKKRMAWKIVKGATTYGW